MCVCVGALALANRFTEMTETKEEPRTTSRIQTPFPCVNNKNAGGENHLQHGGAGIGDFDPTSIGTTGAISAQTGTSAGMV